MRFSVFALAACESEQSHVCSFGEWQTEVEATCITEGMMFRTCDVCGAYEYEPIKPNGHQEITLDGYAATCENSGLTDGKQCKVCGKTTVEQVDIPPLDHSFDNEHDNKCNVCGYERECKHLSTSILHGYEASCENSGLTDGEICLDCHETLVPQTTIPALKHDLGDWNNEIPATCTEDGMLGYYQCSVCGMRFDQDNNVLLDLTIKSAGHQESGWITDKNPTCTDSGIHHKECIVCLKTTTTESIDPSGHNYGVWISVVPATCTENGTLGHYRCSACNTDFDSNKNKLLDLTIKSAGHKESGWTIDKNPTCTESGSRYKECTECKTKLTTESIAPNGHNYGAWISEVPATCTKNGTLGHYRCSACNSTFDSAKNKLLDLTIAAGHKEGDWIIDEDPTCQETGTRHKECTVCYKTTVTDTLPVTDHQSGDWWITDKNSTCTEAGEMHKECIYCGKTTETDTIPATDHLSGNSWIIDKYSTCTEAGEMHKECIYCGKTTKTDTIPAAHNYGSWIDETPSTCIDKGTLGHYYCYRCGKNFDKNDNELSSLAIEPIEHNFEHDYCTMCKMKEPSKGLTYALNPDGKSYSVTGIGACKDAVLSIPSVHNGLPVTSIVAKAFYECIALVSLTIPSSIASIGDEAFYGCYKLFEVYNLSALNLERNNSNNGYAGYYAKSIYKSLHGLSNIVNVNDFLFYELFSEAYLLAYVGDQTSIVLPENCNGKTYTIYKYAFCDRTITNITINGAILIGKNAFYEHTSLKNITIGNDVTLIDSSAFKGCTALESATIGNGVTHINERSFYGCTALKSVIIPDSVTAIYPYAFYGCTSLKSATIGNSVTYISDRSFEGCTSLEIIIIPDSVTAIGSNVFNGCTSLEIIIIPDSVTNINDSSFYGCTSLKSVTIGNGVTSINGEMFYGCTALESIIIPDSVTSIGSNVFNGCTALESITIPNSVTSIYDAFRNCTSLKSATIGNGVTWIGASAFYGCTALESITIPNSVTSIGYSAFEGCTSLKSVIIGNGVTSIGYSAFGGCTALESVIIGNGVTSIGERAFYGCMALSSITIPDSVTSIGERAFRYCNKLVEVYNLSDLTITKYDTNNGWVGYYAKVIHTSKDEESIIKNVNDFLFFTVDDKNYLLGYVGTSTELTLPDGYNGEDYAIYGYAFYDCSAFESVTIGKGVTSIGSSAFYGCTSLTEIYFNAENCTTLDISSVAFANAGLNGDGIKVIIGKNVKTVPSFLFYVNSNGDVAPKIKELEFAPDSSCKTIGAQAFYGCSLLNNISFTHTVTSVGAKAFWGTAYALDENNWTSGGLYFGNYLLNVNTDLIGDFEIKDGTVCIADGAFYGCSALKSITIPNSVIYLGNFTFDSCSALESVTIGSGVTSIGDYAFRWCSALKSITLGNSVTSIGSSAFYGCSALKSITIPNSVTSIGDYAFFNCKALERAAIGNSITSIGEKAFYNCTALKTIRYAGTRAEWGRNVAQGNLWNYYYSSSLGEQRLNYTFICSDDEN